MLTEKILLKRYDVEWEKVQQYLANLISDRMNPQEEV